MKKLIILLLSLIILLTFSSCGTPKKTDVDSAASKVDEIEIKQPTDNSVNGYRISDSKNESVPDFTDTQSKVEQNTNTLYYANINSKKFHYKTCGSASKILDHNLYISDSREELIDNGYSPCARCNP